MCGGAVVPERDITLVPGEAGGVSRLGYLVEEQLKQQFALLW